MAIKKSERSVIRSKAQKTLEIAKAQEMAKGNKPKFLKKGVGEFKPKNRGDHHL